MYVLLLLLGSPPSFFLVKNRVVYILLFITGNITSFLGFGDLDTF